MMNDAITPLILAGGLGTRLRPVVADRSKVMAPVRGRPFLTYLLDQLAASFRRVVLLTGHRADQLQDALGDVYQGMALAYSREPEPRGTAGALRLALPFVTTRMALLMNGDSFCEVDLSAFVAEHRRRRADCSLTLARVEDASPFGAVECDGAGRVTAFAEKRPERRPGWINAGVYLIERPLIETIAVDVPVSLERGVMPAWIAARAVYAHRTAGRFLDIGTPETYARASGFVTEPEA